MKKEESKCNCGEDCKCERKMIIKKCHHHSRGGCNESSALYGLGVIGALFYFVSSAVGFWPVVVAIIKAIFWPAFVVFKILGMLSI